MRKIEGEFIGRDNCHVQLRTTSANTRQHRPNTWALGFVGLLVCALTTGADARTWVVEVDGSGDAPTIQAAILLAAPGDVVEVGPGVYHEAVFQTGGNDIYLRSRLGPGVTVIDGDGVRGVVAIDAGTLEGFTIRNGFQQTGAGLFIGQADAVTSPIVRNNVIENNHATLYPDCCGGAGLYNIAVGTRIENNVIRNNDVEGVGGGIYDVGFDTKILNNLIAFNRAFINTGGLYTARATVSGNLIVGNFGRFTSGGAELESCVEFRHNTVFGNSTANGLNNAAGVRLNDGCGTVSENIIARNRGGGHGVGLVCPPASGTTTCNDVWGNDIDTISGLHDASNFAADPLFCAVDPLGSLSFLLRSNSPCAPGQSPGGSCGLVGAQPVGCGTVSIEQKSWGDVKRLFR